MMPIETPSSVEVIRWVFPTLCELFHTRLYISGRAPIFRLVQMSFQATYSVYGLDFENTYGKLRESEHVTGGLEVTKGTVPFWLNINNEKVKVQITNKGCVNIWHRERTYIDRAVEELKPLTVNRKGEQCEDWVLVNMQIIGSTRIATPLTEEIVRSGTVYPPVPKVTEAKPQADKNTILEHIQKIEGAISLKNWNKSLSSIVELRQLCIHNRTGHVPELLSAIRRFVDTQGLFENEETREELAMVMAYILENEKKSGNTENANEVTKQLLDSIRKIALYDRKNGLVYSLRFLGETEVKESVDVIMVLISQRSSEITGNLEGEIHYVLYGSELAKAQREYVREKLVELSGSEDEPAGLVAMRLQKKPRLV